MCSVRGEAKHMSAACVIIPWYTALRASAACVISIVLCRCSFRCTYLYFLPEHSVSSAVSSAGRVGAMASPGTVSQGRPGTGSQGDLVSAGAKRALAMSKGKMRVPLEDLGPALFNRHGLPTCGRHCNELGKRIVEVEGVATFR